MRELEETNCEIRNILKFELPIWEQPSTLCTEDFVNTEGSKELNTKDTIGGFLGNDCKYAWMSYGTHLAIIDIRYSKCISSWNFSYKVTSVAPFPAKPGHIPLLLVGLANNAIKIRDSIGYLCIYDCCTSTIFTTIQVTAGVEKVCIIHGGSDWEEYNEIRPDSVIPENTGLIFVALRNLQHLVIDMNRLLWENLLYESRSLTAKLDFINVTSSLSSCMTPNKNKKEKIHLAYDLMSIGIEQYMNFDRESFESTLLYDESLCSVLYCSQKTGLLITGCLGRIIIWQNDGSISWISPVFDENSYITHIALLEPSDDPRPFYYLWITSQNDVPESPTILRMFALLFQTKHTDKSTESSLYYNLESEPSLKFELELDQGESVHSLQAIERENLNSADSSRRGEDSLLLVGTNERVLVFDLNRWYKEQMPRTIADCRNPSSVMASYRPKEEIDNQKSCLEICYIPRSLREFPTKGPNSPEELFYPNSLTFEWISMSFDSLSFWLARGVQAEILRDITMAGPILLTRPSEIYRRCISAGLVPFDSLSQEYKNDIEQSQQREMLLTLCLEQRWANFLVKCATEWSDGSADFLYPEFLRWGVQRASELKLIADQLSIPLFDQSGTNIGEAEVRTLRFCAQQLECLTTVVSKLPSVKTDLEKQRRALKRISTYLQVLLWFHDVGLLPETQDLEDKTSQILKIPYPKVKLINYYKEEVKSKIKNIAGDDKMFIEELINRNCQSLISQWEREAAADELQQDSCYPPPSLQSLLRSYLTDCHHEDRDISGNSDDCDQFEINNKHSITIYVLMDLAMLLQNSYPSVDRLIKYPAAFKLSPSLIKLTQAFWLLDHNDSEGFFKLMTSQLILNSDVQDWHHKLAIETLLRNNQHKLALVYMRVLKPPLSSIEDRGTLIGLSVGQGLVETAFHARPPSHYSQLLTRFFQACKAHGKLKEVLFLSLDSEEETAFVKFLEEGGCNDTRLLYYLQRCRHTEASDVYSLDKLVPSSRHSMIPQKIHPTAIKMLGAFNSTLPNITKCFANFQSKATPYLPFSMQKQPRSGFVESHSVETRAYPRPMSQCRNKHQEIYSVAIHKARETCLKTDRSTHSPNYVPFLGAPSSTLVYCSRINGNNVAEPTEAVNVTFPKKQDLRGKRVFNKISAANDEATSKKRMKLSIDISEASEGNEEVQNFRRLSMSQVCYTPLVEKKKQISGRNADGIIIETPQSILKIRQMLGRSSDSSGYDFRNSSSFKERKISKKNSTDDLKPTRQIRFSMDRSSDNECSVDDSMDYQNEVDNSHFSQKTEEGSCIESFYSPNVTTQSMRDNSILSDNSTKFVCGPRAPALKKNLQSHSSNEDLSQSSNSLNSTALDPSIMESAGDFSVDQSIHRSQKVIAPQTSLHCTTILDENSSIENSLYKKSIRSNDSVIDNQSESEDSTVNEEIEEQEMNKIKEIENYEKLTTIDSGVISSSPTDFSQSNRYEELEEGELIDDEEESKNKQEFDENDSVTSNVSLENNLSDDEKINKKYDNKDNFKTFDLSQEHEISEDEESTNQDILKKNNILTAKPQHKTNKNQEKKTSHCSDEFQETAPCVHPEKFEKEIVTIEHPKKSEANQNLSISVDKARSSQNLSFFRRISSHFNFSRNCSLTDNIVADIQCEESDHQNSYSLTKPIFLDSKGIVRFNELTENADITDDESQDDDAVIKDSAQDAKREDNEENNITLNLSEGSESETRETKKEKEKDLELASKVLATELQNEVLGIQRSKSLSRNDSFKACDTNLPEISLTKNNDSGIIETHKRTSILNYKDISPRRPIHESKSPPVSFELEKIVESNIKQKVYQDSLSTVIGCSTVPKIVIQSVTSEPGKDMKESQIKIKQKINETKSKKIVNKSIAKSLQETSNIIIEESTEDTAEKRQINSRATRASSRAKETLVLKTPGTDSIVEEKNHSDFEYEPIKKSTEFRESTQDKDKESKMFNVVRNMRATSVSLEEQVSIIRKARGTSVAKEKNEIECRSSSTIKKHNSTSEAKITEETEVQPLDKITRAASVSKEESLSTSKKPRTTSESKDDNNLEDKTLSSSRKLRDASLAKDDKSPEKHAPKIIRAASTAKVNEKPLRKTRAVSVTKENEKPEEQSSSRKTRAASVAKENEKPEEQSSRKTRAASVAKENEKPDEQFSRKTRTASVSKRDDKLEEKSMIKKTRATSVVKDYDNSEEKSTVKRTRAASVAKDDDKSEEKFTSRKTRATSIAKEVEKIEEKSAIRKTRASSAVKDNQEEKIMARKIRASSLAQEEENIEEKPSIAKRTRSGSVSKESTKKPRASSLAKDTNEFEDLNDIIYDSSGKRSNSLPKEINIETSRLINRTRRSTSLMKDIILEESLSQLSPMPTPNKSRRSKLLANVDSPVVSSPATNTRSRRSSIQSVPEELEEILSVPVNIRFSPNKVESRGRRAISVDSEVIPPLGKRMTRSRLAKTTLVNDVIPEDSVIDKKIMRRKREKSIDLPEKEDGKKGKLKRGRKGSESVIDQLESGAEAQMSDSDRSRAVSLQKIVPSILDDESDDEATNVLRIKKMDCESSSTKVQGPRTCFVMPKKKRDKAK